MRYGDCIAGRAERYSIAIVWWQCCGVSIFNTETRS